jgi:hypothetical protein
MENQMKYVYVFYEMMSDGSQNNLGVYSSIEKISDAINTEGRDGAIFVEDKVRVNKEESETTPRVWIHETHDPEDQWISRYLVDKVTVDDAYELLLT